MQDNIQVTGVESVVDKMAPTIRVAAWCAFLQVLQDKMSLFEGGDNAHEEFLNKFAGIVTTLEGLKSKAADSVSQIEYDEIKSQLIAEFAALGQNDLRDLVLGPDLYGKGECTLKPESLAYILKQVSGFLKVADFACKGFEKDTCTLDLSALRRRKLVLMSAFRSIKDPENVGGVFTLQSNDASGALDDGGESVLHLNAIGSVSASTGTMSVSDALIGEREKGIREINKEAIDLLEMFKAVRQAVSDAQHNLDTIEDNTESALDHTNNALENIEEAAEYQETQSLRVKKISCLERKRNKLLKEIGRDPNAKQFVGEDGPNSDELEVGKSYMSTLSLRAVQNVEWNDFQLEFEGLESENAKLGDGFVVINSDSEFFENRARQRKILLSQIKLLQQTKKDLTTTIGSVAEVGGSVVSLAGRLTGKARRGVRSLLRRVGGEESSLGSNSNAANMLCRERNIYLLERLGVDPEEYYALKTPGEKEKFLHEALGSRVAASEDVKILWGTSAGKKSAAMDSVARGPVRKSDILHVNMQQDEKTAAVRLIKLNVESQYDPANQTQKEFYQQAIDDGKSILKVKDDGGCSVHHPDSTEVNLGIFEKFMNQGYSSFVLSGDNTAESLREIEILSKVSGVSSIAESIQESGSCYVVLSDGDKEPARFLTPGEVVEKSFAAVTGRISDRSPDANKDLSNNPFIAVAEYAREHNNADLLLSLDQYISSVNKENYNIIAGYYSNDETISVSSYNVSDITFMALLDFYRFGSKLNQAKSQGQLGVLSSAEITDCFKALLGESKNHVQDYDPMLIKVFDGVISDVTKQEVLASCGAGVEMELAVEKLLAEPEFKLENAEELKENPFYVELKKNLSEFVNLHFDDRNNLDEKLSGLKQTIDNSQLLSEAIESDKVSIEAKAVLKSFKKFKQADLFHNALKDVDLSSVDLERLEQDNILVEDSEEQRIAYTKVKRVMGDLSLPPKLIDLVRLCWHDLLLQHNENDSSRLSFEDLVYYILNGGDDLPEDYAIEKFLRAAVEFSEVGVEKTFDLVASIPSAQVIEAISGPDARVGQEIARLEMIEAAAKAQSSAAAAASLVAARAAESAASSLLLAEQSIEKAKKKVVLDKRKTDLKASFKNKFIGEADFDPRAHEGLELSTHSLVEDSACLITPKDLFNSGFEDLAESDYLSDAYVSELNISADSALESFIANAGILGIEKAEDISELMQEAIKCDDTFKSHNEPYVELAKSLVEKVAAKYRNDRCIEIKAKLQVMQDFLNKKEEVSAAVKAWEAVAVDRAFPGKIPAVEIPQKFTVCKQSLDVMRKFLENIKDKVNLVEHTEHFNSLVDEYDFFVKSNAELETAAENAKVYTAAELEIRRYSSFISKAADLAANHEAGSYKPPQSYDEKIRDLMELVDKQDGDNISEIKTLTSEAKQLSSGLTALQKEMDSAYNQAGELMAQFGHDKGTVGGFVRSLDQGQLDKIVGDIVANTTADNCKGDKNYEAHNAFLVAKNNDLKEERDSAICNEFIKLMGRDEAKKSSTSIKDVLIYMLCNGPRHSGVKENSSLLELKGWVNKSGPTLLGKSTAARNAIREILSVRGQMLVSNNNQDSLSAALGAKKKHFEEKYKEYKVLAGDTAVLTEDQRLSELGAWVDAVKVKADAGAPSRADMRSFGSAKIIPNS